MPQNSVPKHQRQKKKGRAPAHQNTFAYKHNPNSKKTAKILDLPNVHVCQRCHDKIEWRKKYRKYKPRTQPGKCNICLQRRVMAAYHTICDKCTKSDKAKKIVKEHLMGSATTDLTGTIKPNENENEDTEENAPEVEEEEPADEEEKEVEETDPAITQMRKLEALECGRACAMCVKAVAIPDPDDEKEEDDPLKSGKKLTLRQRKTLERQKEQKKKKKNRKRRDDEEDGADEGPEEDQSNESDFDDMDTDDDENDPFLKAVGGANKLLTGEAYQQSLLQKEQA